MGQNRFGVAVGVLVVALWSGTAAAETEAEAERQTLAYWAFVEESLEPTHGEGELLYEFEDVAFFNGASTNAQEQWLDGRAHQSMALQGGAGTHRDGTGGNNGLSLYVVVNTSGHRDVELSLAARRSGTGFTETALSYSVDEGESFVEINAAIEPGERFASYAFDFADRDLGVESGAMDEVEQLILRMTFTGATHAFGNNRLDHIHVRARPIAE